MKLFDGYFKKDIDNNVLLSKGGNKALADFVGSLYFDDETNTLQYKSAIDTTYTDLFQLGARAFDSTEYLPLSGGTVTGIITGNTGNGIEFQSSNTGPWKEGIRIYPASNGYAVCSCQSKDSKYVLAMVINELTGLRYFDNVVNGTGYPIYFPNKSGTLALTSDITGTFMSKGHFTTTDTTTPGWGTLTSGNGYTGILYWLTSNSGAVAFCQKPGGGDNLISMQIDGFYYQNEGRYRVLDTSDYHIYHSMHIHSDGGSWNEGIRMHVAGNAWCGLVMCGSDNTGDSGTSGRTWGIHNNDGTFYITLNGSTSGTNYLAAGSSGWTFSSAVYSNSDKRLKKDILLLSKEELSNLFDASLDLFKRFTWKSNDITSYGFIAQEIQLYIPEAVSVNPGSKYLTVSYDTAYAKIIPAIIYKVKELQEIIKNMEKRIKTLEANQAPPPKCKIIYMLERRWAA